MQKKKTQKPDEYTPAFLEFWSVYPFRRGSKYDAFRAFKKAVDGIVSESEVISAAGRFAAIVVRKKTEPNFVPHASTWLNGRRWETIDDIEAEQQQAEQLQSAAGSGNQRHQTAEEFTRSSVEEWLRLFNGNTLSHHEQKVLSYSNLSLGAIPG